MKVRSLVYVAMMTVLLTLSGWLVVPAPIPFTMQTFVIFLAVGLLGVKDSFLSVAVYLLMGAIGLPVFAGMNGGIGVLAGPTGGYLMGFLAIPLVTGLIKGNRVSTPVVTVAMLCGLAADYLVGVAWYTVGYARQEAGVWAAVVTGVLPFVVPDVIKIALAVGITKKVRPMIRDRSGDGLE